MDYDQAWKLLVSVRLAAQCTDARVNMIVPTLFEKYPGVEALADADVADIEEIVRPCGLGKSKARDISACMKMLRDEFDGKVPKDFNALLKLPGVDVYKRQKLKRMKPSSWSLRLVSPHTGNLLGTRRYCKCVSIRVLQPVVAKKRC